MNQHIYTITDAILIAPKALRNCADHLRQL